MAILYCQHSTCGAGYGAAGAIPPSCPACGRDTWWRLAPDPVPRGTVLPWPEGRKQAGNRPENGG